LNSNKIVDGIDESREPGNKQQRARRDK